MSELRDCVSESDVKKTIQVLYGPDVELIDYQVAPASSVVLGFSSLILRVTANVKISEDHSDCITLIAKRLPVAQSQLHVMNDTDFFQREVLYFQEARPLLRGADLPIVRCVRAQPGLIMLEDLTPQGFRMLTHDMSDLSSNVLHYPHLKMIMEKLAQIHAASLDQNWLHILPYLKQDAFLEVAACPFPSMFKRACNAYAAAMSEYYPNVSTKYSEWLRSSKPLETLLKFVKPTGEPSELLVLAHGDFWVNNIMFKLDSTTNLPVDVKFVDFQMCRYVPPSRDIFNLLDTCTDKKARDQHEADLLKHYVSSFNSCLGYERLKLEDFLHEYNSSRIFGISLALVFRSMNLMPDLYPSEGEEMSSEKFANLTSGDHFDVMLQRCATNSYFADNVKELLLQLITELDKLGV